MPSSFLLIAVLIPIIGGILIPLLPFHTRRQRLIFTEGIVVLNSILVWCLLLNRPENVFTAIYFTGNLSISFQLDGLSMVFAGLISTLWPLAVLYSFEYMEQERHEPVFFLFYTATYGVTLGIAMAANAITMYCFYEMLTLVTVPLVMHTLSREAILASRKYLYYSLGGAAFAFIGILFIVVYGENSTFIFGGFLQNIEAESSKQQILLLVYLFTFLGFGVKAAIFPFNAWLPKAGVAPTPVTALLHAVAVVKSGAFAIMRITYYCFGTPFLKGTWVQTTVMLLVLFTILYGCSMALKERHLKRRLAYSTISNLSYILFGIVIMTPLGLAGALFHMVFHAVMKITSFFCAGAVIHKTGKTYIYELNGLAAKMPKTCSVFAVSALALMGVPGLCGFVSKWNLAKAAADSQDILAYVGVGTLLLSALLTALYMLTIVVRMFFLKPEEPLPDGSLEPSWQMLLPLFLFTGAIFFLGLCPGFFLPLFQDIANGIL